MVGKDEQAPAIELLQSVDLVLKHIKGAHRADDAAESQLDQVASDSLPLLRPSNDKIQNRKYKHTADANRQETQPNAKYAPTPIKSANHNGTTANVAGRWFVRGKNPCANKNAKPPNLAAVAQRLEIRSSQSQTK
jgi:hypothetical protein